MYTIEHCKSKAAYRAVPGIPLTLDMQSLAQHFEVILDAGIVLVLRLNGEEVIVHSYGEILFKSLQDQDKMKDIADQIYRYKK